MVKTKRNIKIKNKIKNKKKNNNRKTKRKSNKTIHIKKEAKDVKSYSPTINNELISLRSFTPNYEIYNCVNSKEFKIRVNNKDKCIFWKNKLVKINMLKNLFSNKYNGYKYTQINTPKQLLGNCWFNAALMMFFISDKGRKFFRNLRKSMIVGKYLDNTPLPKKTQWPLFMYNKYIDSVLQKKTPENHAWLMDTNNVIKSLYNTMGIGVKVNEAYNPFEIYDELIKFLTKNNKISNKIIIEKLYLKQMKKGINLHKKKQYTIINNKIIKSSRIPHILSIRMNGYEENGNILTKLIKIKINGKDVTYKLDSALALDNDGEHFCSFITFNGKQLIHDGYMESRHEPFKWKSYLCDFKNIKKPIILKYDNGYENEFNFSKTPYCQALYYRDH